MCFQDWAHITALGIYRDVIASVAIRWARRGGPLRPWLLAEGLSCTNVDSTLEALWCHVRFWFQRHGHTPPSANPTVMHKLKKNGDDWAELPGWVKAIPTNLIVHALQSLCDSLNAHLGDARTSLHCSFKHIEIILWGICNANAIMDEAMESSRSWMSRQAAAEFCESMDRVLDSYNVLHQLHRDKGLFHVRPKHHYLRHIVEFVRRTRMNPKSLQTLSCETFLGKLKNCGRTSNGNPLSMPASVLLKWKMAALSHFTHCRPAQRL